MTQPIPPHTSLSATFAPKLPTHLTPPGIVIPWIGSRLNWMAFREPNFGNPNAVSFVLVAGSDGFGVSEGRAVHAPPIVAMRGDLEGIRISREVTP